MSGSYIKGEKYKIVNKIKDELQACPFFNDDYGDIVTYPLYREKDDCIFLPRFYNNKKVNIHKNYNQGREVNFKFTKSLRKQQIDIVDECLTKIKDVSGGIINLPCGYGKTVIALYLASIMKVKTLVIVHKTFLQDQWVSRAKEFTNAKIGIIRQKKIDTKNKDIVIGMLQSISMIDYDEKIFEEYGLVIYDEAHHIISKVFSNALFKINSQYIIGLTATPNRSGNLTKGLKLHLGDIIYKIEKKADEHAIVKVFNYQAKNKLFVEKKLFFRGKIKPNLQKMINNICNIDDRNKLLVDIIYSLWNIEDRKILVLSGRTTKVPHLKMLKTLLDEKITDEIDKGNLLVNECKSYYYTGKTSQLERAEAEKYADILFATYEMAHEGLDIQRLNTVIMATSKTSVQQAIGRIMRKASYEISTLPLIIDFVDLLSTFPNQFKKREILYKKLNYDVENYYLKNDKIITKKEYMKEKYNYTDEELDKEFDDDYKDYEANFDKILLTEHMLDDKIKQDKIIKLKKVK